MERLLKHYWIPAACVVFILVNTALMVKDIYWLNLLPVALLAAWAAIAATDKLLLFIVFATPLSINLEELDFGGIGVSLPTEPLMVGLTVLFLLKLALEGGVVEGRVWRHPITLVILAQLAWMAICIIPSSMVLVSLKHVAARVWFVCTMYFMATRLFQDPRNMHRFLWCFLAGLSIVVGYTLVQHALHGFAEGPAHWVMYPFFKDHTAYGAIIAFFLPFTAAAISMPGYSRTRRMVAVLLLLLLGAGIIFSYTRAAWVGVAGALGVLMVMRLRIPAWVVGLLAVVGAGIVMANMDRITIALERNRAESHDDLAKHVSSIGNISSDASNLERINRWNSALRMFEEKPLMGWGPGTYVFQYAPFQASGDRTIISTNFGLNGNAHSEYLGPLAEQGLLGLFFVLLLAGTIITTGIRLWSKLPPGVDRHLVGAALLGLISYMVHGLLNNYLDLDKANVPFWGMSAMLVMLDLKYRDLQSRKMQRLAPPGPGT